MNEILKAIQERRSCKKYKSDPVPQEIIEQVVEAGLFAASAMGKQAPIVIAVSNKEIRDKLCRLNSKYDAMHREDPFYNAPVVLAVLAPKEMGTAVYDGSLVLGNMMLAAHSLEIGSCWIHRAKEVFEDEEGKELLKSLGVEGEYVGIGHCILGYPEVVNKNIIPRKDGRVFRVY